MSVGADDRHRLKQDSEKFQMLMWLPYFKAYNRSKHKNYSGVAVEAGSFLLKIRDVYPSYGS